tara:strand:- start:4354 stop:5166 length:813 start_codon:yes stop_codon:yes gene_type:complete
MATEISFSGGLTFRVTDSNGDTQFDINKKQPKVVATHNSSLTVPDMEVRIKAYGDPSYPMFSTLPPYSTSSKWGIVDNYVMKQLFTHFKPSPDFFFIWHLYFPSSQQSELRIAGTSNNATIANANNRFLFYNDLDKWIQANGGMPIRHMFSINAQRLIGADLFFYKHANNASYQDPQFAPNGSSPNATIYNHPYVIVWGVHRGICGRIGGIDMTNNSNVNSGFHSSPYVYNLSMDGTSNAVGSVNHGMLGTGKVKMTHYNFLIRLHMCKG